MSVVPEMLAAARSQTYAVGAFNVFDVVSMTSVLEAALKADAPVVVQTSAVVARRLGPGLIAAMFREISARYRVPSALQLDHCSDLGLISACLQARWDAVLFDGSMFEPDENARLTSEVVAEAHRCGVAVEGELDSIRGSEAGVPSVVRPLRSIRETLDFIEATGIDAFAPSIGTVHGRTEDPIRVDIERLSELAAATPVPLVLHGGTGIPDQVADSLIDAGITKINVSTDVRDAYMEAVRDYVANGPSDADPITMQDRVSQALRGSVSMHLKRTRSYGQASRATGDSVV